MPRPTPPQPTDEADSPWKEALERYFPEFLALFFPEAHAGIDWSRGYQFLDRELQRVTRDAKLGTREVDKLAQVWRPGGVEAWVLVHVEVQGQPDPEFPLGMYVYNYRLFDRHRRQIASLAVLTDPRPDWRPERFAYELWGSRAGLEFSAVKLLDWHARRDELEQSPNPFAVVALAHLMAQATRKQPEARREWKLRVVKGLYRRGFSREDILELFRFIDWLMALPEGLAEQFETDLAEFEEVERMPYVTSIDRRALQQGREERVRFSDKADQCTEVAPA